MRVKLKVLVGSGAGKEIPVPVSRFLIGRADDCHMRPKSDAISRNHCAILVKEDCVVIRDLNSRNGTFVNGERIQGDCELKAGDKIGIGKLEFEAVIKESKKSPGDQKPEEKGEAKAERKSEAKPEKKQEAKSEKKGEAKPEKKREAKPEKKLVKPEKKLEAVADEDVEDDDLIAKKSETSAGKAKGDSASIDFDVSEWLEEADAVAKARRNAEPETRQYQLDETDRIALEQAAAGSGDTSEGKKAGGRPDKKQAPGKLPPMPGTQAATSRDAAADMLKKFFNNR
jgi:pSer/pThr/pTyr-binding forkhead associated (FHA) protein